MLINKQLTCAKHLLHLLYVEHVKLTGVEP